MPVYLAAGAAFLVYFALASVAGINWLGLSGTQLYLFLGLLGALGLTGSALFIYFQNKRSAKKEAAAAGGAAAPAEGGSPEVEGIIRSADARLAQSKVAQGATIANLPLVFILGDQGTAKTSTIINSGLEAELLAGQVYGDNNVVVQTMAANAWFARGSVFIEAGGALLGDPSKWQSLIKRIKPGSLKSVVGKGTQSPRAVLLCFDLESFLRPGASEALAGVSRYLQARLGEISQLLGISFPVYVLFTKADRLPFFADYVRNLNNEEAGQVFGVTLPMRDPHKTGVYAEEESSRLTNAFNNLVYSLGDKRVVFLPRETEADKLPGAYEFPREFRKLRQGLVQLLVDVCRPSQLRSSPFLRGFYFSGVRPVVVSDVSSPSAPASSTKQTLEQAGGATRMFRAGVQQQQLAQQGVAGQQSANARKVPQWMFLGHLFNDVIFQDTAAMGASGSSVKTSGLQRVLLGIATFLFLLYSGFLIASYFGNRSLEEEALTAAKNISANEASGANIASVDSLRRLDVLRTSLEKLTDYQQNGAPWHLHWGLYSGSEVYPHVRQIYYNKFAQLLFTNTQAGMLSFLQKTPQQPTPTDDFGYAYNTLKGYLLTSSEFSRSSDKPLQVFLANLLRERWTGGRDADIGKERIDLAKAQFDFYSKDLHNGNPYSSDSDSATVGHARDYLSRFSGYERVYRGLKAQADKKGDPASFNQKFPGSADVVLSSSPVDYAFTKEGYGFLMDRIKKQDFGGEQWVLGPDRGQAIDKGAMQAGVIDAYSRDYIKTWRTVLKTSSVTRYSDLKDAAAKLTKLSGGQSVLLNLFWWVSRNTNVDLPHVSEAFRSVQAVVPPSDLQQYVVAQNSAYNSALLTLQQGIDQASQQPTMDTALANATQQQANAAKLTTSQLTSSFSIDPEANLQKTAELLLLAPITNAEAMIKSKPNEEANRKAGGFCSALSQLTSKFPFRAEATQELTIAELNDFFRPKEGKLWALYEGGIKAYIVCQNGDCQPAPNPPGTPNPAFVRFFSQAAKFSRALYGDSRTDPSLTYTLRPAKSDQVEKFDVLVNSDTASLAGGASKSFVWPGTAPQRFKLTLKIAGGSALDVTQPDGLWAVFHFFADANRATPSGAGYDFVWDVSQGKKAQPMVVLGRPLTYQFNADTGVFNKDFLSQLKCSGAVAH